MSPRSRSSGSAHLLSVIAEMRGFTRRYAMSIAVSCGPIASDDTSSAAEPLSSNSRVSDACSQSGGSSGSRTCGRAGAPDGGSGRHWSSMMRCLRFGLCGSTRPSEAMPSAPNGFADRLSACDTAQHAAMQHSATRRNATQCNTPQCNTVQHAAMQHSATCCSAVQLRATQNNAAQRRTALPVCAP